MKSFMICSCVLLLCMAADTSAKALAPASSTEEAVDMDKLRQIIGKLASKPAYEGPYEVLDGDFDHPHAVLTNDTDESNGEGERDKRYANEFDEGLFFICPRTDSISRITSYHDNHREDRRYSISCKRSLRSNPHCYMSGWVNHYDEQFTFSCHSNNAITGIVSYHSNHHEDRRCCGPTQYHRVSCHWTPYVNNFDAYFNWNVPYNAYLAGVSSYHDNGREDRRFKFYICY